MTEEQPYYTIRQLATKLHKTPKTLYRWIGSGKLKSERVGAEYRIKEEDWLETYAAFNRKLVAVTTSTTE